MTLRELINNVTDNKLPPNLRYLDNNPVWNYNIVVNTFCDTNVNSYTEMNIKDWQVDHERSLIKLEII